MDRDDNSNLLEDGFRARVARLLGCQGLLLQQSHIVGNNLEFSSDAIVEVVLLAEALEHLGELWVAVAWHCREEVMFKLPLHTAPQDVGNPVVALSITSRAELSLHEIVLTQCVAEENFLRLVSHRHDGGRDEPRQPNGEKKRAEGHKRGKGTPVNC
eukprot:scaffold184153_cov31-Tisochrysis_lutea.AAC.1